MKNKTKKLLTGLVLGAVGAMTLTGCTATDITLNQEDLDKIISGANKYLEYQNDYSSEHAQNMLNDMLIETKTNHLRTNSYIIGTIEEYYDSLGVMTQKGIYRTVKHYDSNTKTTKIRETANGTDRQRSDKYYEIKFSKVSGETEDSKVHKYESKAYDLVEKTYTTTEDKSKILNIGYQDILTTIDNIYAYANGLYSNEQGDISLNTLGENHYEFKFITYSHADEEDSGALGEYTDTNYHTIVFKDGNIYSYEMITTRKMISDETTIVETMRAFVQFGINTGDFTVEEVGECTLVEAGE